MKLHIEVRVAGHGWRYVSTAKDAAEAMAHMVHARKKYPTVAARVRPASISGDVFADTLEDFSNGGAK